MWPLNLKQEKNTPGADVKGLPTKNHLLFCEHPPVYTLGKSGNIAHVLLTQEQLEQKQISFFHTNRGGDITFHGPQQVVGYPILDLEKFTTDIGLYLRNLEEVIIKTIAEYGITGERSKGETGVWIQPGVHGRERKNLRHWCALQPLGYHARLCPECKYRFKLF